MFLATVSQMEDFALIEKSDKAHVDLAVHYMFHDSDEPEVNWWAVEIAKDVYEIHSNQLKSTFSGNILRVEKAMEPLKLL